MWLFTCMMFTCVFTCVLMFLCDLYCLNVVVYMHDMFTCVLVCACATLIVHDVSCLCFRKTFPLS